MGIGGIAAALGLGFCGWMTFRHVDWIQLDKSIVYGIATAQLVFCLALVGTSVVLICRRRTPDSRSPIVGICVFAFLAVASHVYLQGHVRSGAEMIRRDVEQIDAAVDQLDFEPMVAPLDVQGEAIKPEDFHIEEVRAQLRRAPKYDATNVSFETPGAWANMPWLLVTTTFATDVEWVDHLVVRFYVRLGQGRHSRMFTGDVTLMNVKKGGHHVSGMFMHPSTLHRYGQGRYEEFGVQLIHHNAVMGHDGSVGKTQWWEKFVPVPGHLHTPNCSPWSVEDHEFFETSKISP